jgi:hypothetical protein
VLLLLDDNASLASEDTYDLDAVVGIQKHVLVSVR